MSVKKDLFLLKKGKKIELEFGTVFVNPDVNRNIIIVKKKLVKQL